MTMAPLTVVAVHGIRCHARAHDIPGFAKEWRESLQPNINQPITLDMAYWYPSLGLPAAMGNDALHPTSPGEELLAELMLGDLGGPIPGEQGPAGGAVNALLRVMVNRWGADRHYDHPLVRGFLREVARYFHPDHADKRVAAQQVVLDAITRYRPHVVVGHSFGTVITHEALWNAALSSHKLPRVPLLVTMGSPLGMQKAIIEQLQPHRLERPPNVDAWVNLRESGDYVTCAGKLTEHYEGLAADETFDAPGTFMPHDATHYLEHPRTAELITLHG